MEKTTAVDIHDREMEITPWEDLLPSLGMFAMSISGKSHDMNLL